MRIIFITWLFSITILTILCIRTIPVYSQCLEDQRSLLLQLKKTLDFNLIFSVKLVNWTQGNDCCGWKGVTCDQNGHVTGLDLNSESINGGVNKNSSLFSLKFLESLNLAYNSFKFTQIPSSFGNLTSLTYLNLSNAGFSGQIPIELSHLTRFQGGIDCEGEHKNSWPKLQIIDLALNNFSGFLPQDCFLHLKAMMVDGGNAQSKPNYVHFKFLQFNPFDYQATVTVTIKGQQLELVKILTIFTFIDFSNNIFRGEIPHTVGALKYLYVLNLSQNFLTGHIPSSLGNLTQLESLDLSMNKLSGSIPEQLASLTFLSFLNLSFNRLVGRIPIGTQIQSFSETSFEGNGGLCGAPLNTNCSDVQMPTGVLPLTPDEDGDLDFEPGIYISFAVGFVVGLGSFIGALALCKRWRQWYYKHVDQVLERTFHLEESRRRRNRRKRAYRDPIQRL